MHGFSNYRKNKALNAPRMPLQKPDRITRSWRDPEIQLISNHFPNDLFRQS